MEQVLGKRLEKMDAAAFLTLCQQYEQVHLDMGSGDGLFVYNAARQNPRTLMIGVEPAWENMCELAAKSQRKASKGGAKNLLLVRGCIESPAPELQACADLVTVNFPWGSLLNGLAHASEQTLQNLSFLAKPQCKLQITLNLQVFDDQVQRNNLGLPELTEDYITNVLVPAFLRYSFKLEKNLRDANPSSIRSRWSAQLTKGSARPYLILAFCRKLSL